MLSVTFLHLDLGIGGAKRLIVDAAVTLQKKDCAVHIVTTHQDESHCFSETRDGSIYLLPLLETGFPERSLINFTPYVRTFASL
ncbi:hypothetical protein V9T40_013050 [Parthenolecanium corni]|uniref:Uncharacterized protein n=1 Tax=Parthenolecanium corni TaxID=536013 RepID=A0AAN9TBZ4_9HEMI